MATRTSITLENLKALGADKLARLVLDETERNAAFKRQVTAGLAELAGPQAAAKIVDRRLGRLERAKSFVDRDKARSFRDDLQSVVDTIEGELAKPAPDIAADRLLRFIATHKAVFERVDDSNGSVQDVYYQAIEALGSVAERLLAKDTTALPDRILTALGETSHGYLVDVTEAVTPLLPAPVLHDWDAELASRIERRAEEERTRATDRWHYSMTSQWREMRQIIAGARGDLDLLMRLEREKPGHPRDKAGIAARSPMPAVQARRFKGRATFRLGLVLEPPLYVSGQHLELPFEEEGELIYYDVNVQARCGLALGYCRDDEHA